MIVDNIEDTNARKQEEFDRERALAAAHGLPETLPRYSPTDPLSVPAPAPAPTPGPRPQPEASTSGKQRTPVYISPPEIHPVRITYDSRPVRIDATGGLKGPHYILSRRAQHLSTTTNVFWTNRPFPVPRALPEHDVLQSDWKMLLQDIETVTNLTRLEAIISVGASVNIASSKIELEMRKGKVRDVSEHLKQWNILFFLPRRLDVYLAKGSRRLSGPFRSLQAHRSDFDLEAPLLTAAPVEGAGKRAGEGVGSDDDDSEGDSVSLALNGPETAGPAATARVQEPASSRTPDPTPGLQRSRPSLSRTNTLAPSIHSESSTTPSAASSSMYTIRSKLSKLSIKSKETSNINKTLKYASFYRIVVEPL